MAGKKSPANRLEQTRRDSAEADCKIGALEAERNAALLADRDAEAAKLDAELETLRRLARGFRDKIGLLEAEAERQEAAWRVKEHANLIGRIEKKLAERDAAGAELQAAITKCDELFRKMIQLGRAIDAAWNWQPHDRPACLLPGGAVLTALQHEVYRVGARPRLLGGQDGTDALDFPGGACPRIEWRGLPDRITPLVDVLKAASATASAIMRSGLSTASPAFAASAEPAHATSAQSWPMPCGLPTRGGSHAGRPATQLPARSFTTSVGASGATTARHDRTPARTQGLEPARAGHAGAAK
jgi:hypothetical protein